MERSNGVQTGTICFSLDARLGASYTPRLQAIAVVSRAFARPHLMKTKDIMALPVRELIDPEGCHLYLWTTNNFLPDALEEVQAWGFEYVTIITWMKDRQGLGQYYRGMTKHCILPERRRACPTSCWMETPAGRNGLLCAKGHPQRKAG